MIKEAKIASAHANAESSRPSISGKFLVDRQNKFWVKGVTYGTFRPHQGLEYNRRSVEMDFALMRQNHVNSVRVYTIPPIWMLDLAQTYGLKIFIGLPWEQHVTFLNEGRTVANILHKLNNSLRDVPPHPAILCCSIGNEIPSTIVRWHGPEKVQRFLQSLYDTAKDCNPNLPVTYVNYPSTEYLYLPFLDLFSFNVFLESKADFYAYLLRLQNLAGEKPLLLTEIGLDSRRNGLERQARLIRSQIWSAFRSGCAGVFVYAWTDEWFRGDEDVEDWDFGLTTRDRHPKPALDAVRKQFSKIPFALKKENPKISVVVCSYNGEKND